MVKMLTFAEAIEGSKSFKLPKTFKMSKTSKASEISYPPRERHLLLGNGFSIACDSRFDHRSLFEAAQSSNAFSKNEEIPRVFMNMQTKDFEQVIRILEDASKVSNIYDSSGCYAGKMIKDAKALKKILIRTIVNTHPATPDEIDSNKFVACQEFLEYFLGDKNKGGGEIYTLNYDLLLYWARLRNDLFLGDDGFRGKESLVWGDKNQQTFHYLHGALHLSYDGAELHKHRWNPGHPLRNQVLGKILSDKFPLFVAEGDSEQKRLKIESDEYLRYSYNNFARKMEQPNDVLFIFGHSLNETDDHILDCIVEGKISRVYVSLYHDPESGYDPSIVEKAKKWETRRSNGYPLKVKFFDAESAKVWG